VPACNEDRDLMWDTVDAVLYVLLAGWVEDLPLAPDIDDATDLLLDIE
jgi:hypothetical protein